MCESDVCPVCLEPLRIFPHFLCRVEVHHLSCGHKLHERCWSQCLNHGRTRCPLCRKSQATLDRERDHPHSWLAGLVFVIARRFLAGLAMCGILWKTSPFDVQRNILNLIPTSMRRLDFFRWSHLETRCNAANLSGVLGCVVNVCKHWFVVGLIGSAITIFLAIRVLWLLYMRFVYAPAVWCVGRFINLGRFTFFGGLLSCAW